MAFLALLKHIVLSGGTAQHLLNVLAEGSHEDTVRVFSGVIHLWLEYIGLQIKNDAAARQAKFSLVSEGQSRFEDLPPVAEAIVKKTFYGEAKRSFYEKILDVDTALYNIIQFAAKAAKQNRTTRLGMLDAGCLVLVLTAFANHDFKLAGLVSMPGEGRAEEAKMGRGKAIDSTASCPFRLSVAAINAGASTLLVVMRYNTFREFLGEHRFNTRLSLCSSLVDSMIGEDGGSRETRALFTQIVGR
jgi:hypothetical protein